MAGHPTGSGPAPPAVPQQGGSRGRGSFAILHLQQAEHQHPDLRSGRGTQGEKMGTAPSWLTEHAAATIHAWICSLGGRNWGAKPEPLKPVGNPWATPGHLCVPPRPAPRHRWVLQTRAVTPQAGPRGAQKQPGDKLQPTTAQQAGTPLLTLKKTNHPTTHKTNKYQLNRPPHASASWGGGGAGNRTDRAAPAGGGSAFASQQLEQSWTLAFSAGRGCRRNRSQGQGKKNSSGNKPGKSLQHPPAPQPSSSSPEMPFTRQGRAGPVFAGPPPAREGQGTAGWHPPLPHPITHPHPSQENQQQFLPGHLQRKEKAPSPGHIYFKAANKEAISSQGLIAGNLPCLEEKASVSPSIRWGGLQPGMGKWDPRKAAKQIPSCHQGKEVWES